jgi:hypothetical protein
MPDFMTRLEIDDYETWLDMHRENVDNRTGHGMLDGPIYRDIDNPNAVVIHTRINDLDRALHWLRSEASHQVSTRATIKRRDIYVVEKFDPAVESRRRPGLRADSTISTTF